VFILQAATKYGNAHSGNPHGDAGVAQSIFLDSAQKAATVLAPGKSWFILKL
jgi:hypothetical protein